MTGKPKSGAGAGEASVRVRGYLAELAPGPRKHLKALRAAIRAAAPGVTDAWSYGIPAFDLNGRRLIWYAGWQGHSSMYPLNAAMRRAGSAALKEYQLAKGTIRFLHDRPVPVSLVKKLIKARVAELRATGLAAAVGLIRRPAPPPW